jgi:hypothetical protein
MFVFIGAIIPVDDDGACGVYAGAVESEFVQRIIDKNDAVNNKLLCVREFACADEIADRTGRGGLRGALTIFSFTPSLFSFVDPFVMSVAVEPAE